MIACLSRLRQDASIPWESRAIRRALLVGEDRIERLNSPPMPLGFRPTAVSRTDLAACEPRTVTFS